MYKRKSKFKSIMIIILTLFIIAGISYYLYNTYKNIEIADEEEYIADRTSTNMSYEENVEEEEKSKDISEVIEEVTNSVCGISKLTSTGISILSTATESDLGLGTGVIVSSNGYILSNTHVTGEKYSSCYVTIEDGYTYTGTVVWADVDLDLSILKIDAEDLDYVTLGDSDQVKVGETVYAIGNPIGYEFRKTVTSGIISATNRTIKIEEDEKQSYMSNLIQTDATINPGNSGGPLIYSNGDVIGINSVKITSAEGIGFAIPINVIRPVIESFIQKGSFEEATLGVYVYDESVAKYLKLESQSSIGLYVADIVKNGPAINSGLKSGDIITAIDGIYIKTVNDLKKYIYSKAIGENVILEIDRGKTKKEIQITLDKK